MSVNIDLDLEAKDVYAELAQIEVLLKSLGSDMRDIDLDFGDLSDITKEIQGLVDALEDAEERIGRMANDLTRAAEAWRDIDLGIHQFPGAAETTIEQENGGGGGVSADGDGSGDPDRGGGQGRTNVKRAFANLYGFNPGIFDKMDATDADKFRNAIADFHNIVQHGETFNLKGDILPGDVQPQRASQMTSRSQYGVEPASMMEKRRRLGIMPALDIGGDFLGETDRRSRFDVFEGGIRTLSDTMSRFDDEVAAVMPTMKKWWQLIALLVPLLIPLAGYVLGLAGALGSVAVAGGALIGLGLLGHADSMGGAFDEARERVKDFKEELFEVFQPAMRTFAPISEGFLDFAPEEMTGIASEMQNLTQYAPTLFEMWTSLTGGVQEFFAIINRNEDAISQLALRFGGIVGSGLLEWFEWLIQSTYRNQELFIDLGELIIEIIVIIYNASVAVAWLASSFKWVFDILVGLSDLLGSRLVVGLITMAAWGYIVGKVIGGLGLAFIGLGKNLLKATAFLFGYEQMTWRAVAATAALAAVTSAITLGVGYVIGKSLMDDMMKDLPSGPGDTPFGGAASGSGAGGPGGQVTVVNNNEYNYTFENNGPMDNDQEQRFRSQFSRMQGEQQARSAPTFGGSRSSSGMDIGGN